MRLFKSYMKGRFLAPTMGAIQDICFEYKYKTDTLLNFVGNLPDVKSEYRDDGSITQGSDVYSFRRTMDFAKTLEDFPLENFTDIGSGKGKAMMMAAEYGFKSITGVEFSPLMCAFTDRNLTKYKDKSGSNAAFTVICGDATTYEIPDESTVFYLYHPFKGNVLALFLDNIEVSLAKSPRKIWIIYMMPKYPEIIEGKGYKKMKDLSYADDAIIFCK